MLPEEIPELVEILVPETLRVHAPKPILLLCGGKIDVTSPEYSSLRDAYSRICTNEPFSKYKTLIPEEINPFFPDGNYDDWLEYENDLAQISDVILLFSESFGSAAELGAFCVAPDISPKLLVGIDQNSYDDGSFIKYGPIRYLRNRHGASALLLMANEELGVPTVTSLASLKLPEFTNYMKTGLAVRASRRDEHTTFNSERNGHLVKLIAGLVQHYGALELEEIDVLLYHLNIRITDELYGKLILCGNYAGWFASHQIGAREFIVGLDGAEALQYKFRQDAQIKNKIRWKAAVVDHWKSVDAERFSAIRAGIQGRIR